MALTDRYAIANKKYKCCLMIATHRVAWQSAVRMMNAYEDSKIIFGFIFSSDFWYVSYAESFVAKFIFIGFF